jgi:hypothetical protein
MYFFSSLIFLEAQMKLFSASHDVVCFFPGLFSSQVMEKNRNFNVKFIPREKLKPNFVGVFFNLFDFFINLFSLATVLNVNTIELLATSNLGFYVVFLHRLTCDVERRRVSKNFSIFSIFSHSHRLKTLPFSSL